MNDRWVNRHIVLLKYYDYSFKIFYIDFEIF